MSGSPPPPILELDAVSFVRDGRSIIDDLTWRVRRGEQWAVIGANGSGKTTLLQLVTGYLWSTSGHRRVLGETLGRTDVRALRRRVGWVSSSLLTRFPSESTAEDIVVSGRFASLGVYEPVSPADRADAREALERLGALEVATSPWRVLSQGERQRTLIARALMARPDLLVLDEPCAGLDLGARERFLAMIQSMASGGAGPSLVMVTHHVEEIVPGFDRVLLLKEGRALAAGPAEEVLTSPNLTKTLGIALTVERRDGRWTTRLDGGRR